MDARGSIYFDDEGEKWIDLFSGNLRCSLGHRSPIVEQAIKGQAGLFQVDPMFGGSCKHLRHLLSQMYPAPMNWYFPNSQEQAVELALMAAMENRLQQTGRSSNRVLALTDSYFGSSFGAGCFFHDYEHYKRPFQILEASSREFLEDGTLDHLRGIEFDAFILEPIQLTTGFGVGYEGIEKARRWCDDWGASLIIDESVTSLSRCGVRGFISGKQKFADVVIASSALGQGLPVTAVGFSKKHFEEGFIPERGWPLANPFCCRIAAEVVRAFQAAEWAKWGQDLGLKWLEALIKVIDKECVTMEGSLIHINFGVNAGMLATALVSERIVAGIFPPWLILAPAFSTPTQVTEEAIIKVCRICTTLGGSHAKV